MRSVKLPSGAELKVYPAPFIDAKNLYQALLRELRIVQIDSKAEVANLFKELFCIGFSSPDIEAYVWECLKRCTYNNGKGDLKIDKDTFEDVKSRQDYIPVCVEVVKENVDPFMKSLYVEYAQYIAMAEKTQKSK